MHEHELDFDTGPAADSLADAVPDKFRDPDSGTVRVDALVKSYRALERKLGAGAHLGARALAGDADDAGPDLDLGDDPDAPAGDDVEDDDLADAAFGDDLGDATTPGTTTTTIGATTTRPTTFMTSRRTIPGWRATPISTPPCTTPASPRTRPSSSTTSPPRRLSRCSNRWSARSPPCASARRSRPSWAAPRVSRRPRASSVPGARPTCPRTCTPPWPPAPTVCARSTG